MHSIFKLMPFKFYRHEKDNDFVLSLEETLEFKTAGLVHIAGESGAGKSTLLKIIKGIIPNLESGFLTQRAVSLEISGNSILYLFQNPFSQLIYTTPEEEFYFSMENKKWPHLKMQEMKEFMTEKFHLKEIWGKKNHQLSHGECQRLLLSSMLSAGADILLLDEPTAFLDPEARNSFYEYLGELKKNHLIFIIDHNIDECLHLVSQRIVVENKKISMGVIHKTNQQIEKQTKAVFPVNQDHSLELVNLSFGYNKSQFLFEDLSFKVCGGEALFVVGENGAGKSTLFKILNNEIKNIQSHLVYKNKNNIRLKDALSIIEQNPENHFYFDTIEEEIQAIQLEKEKLDALIEMFLPNMNQKKSPFLLSEGEKRRLSMLIGASYEPDVYLFDEPTFGLDEKNILHFISYIKKLKSESKILVIICHDEKIIELLADQVLRLGRKSIIHGSSGS